MIGRLLAGDIDWIETDHAPHAPAEKRGPTPASGIPVLPFYPRFIRVLLERGMSRARLDEVTHDTICRTFGIAITNRRRLPDEDLSREYPMNAFPVDRPRS